MDLFSPARLLAFGVGAHAAGRSTGNAAVARYVERVHRLVQRSRHCYTRIFDCLHPRRFDARHLHRRRLG